jgi:hypothetical protein
MKTIVIDDLRFFRDRTRPATMLKNSKLALAYLEEHKDEHFDELWLDHDLGEVNGHIDTIMVVVDYLAERAFNGNPFNVDLILVHTSNPVGAKQILATLGNYGYTVKREIPEKYFIV